MSLSRARPRSVVEPMVAMLAIMMITMMMMMMMMMMITTSTIVMTMSMLMMVMLVVVLIMMILPMILLSLLHSGLLSSLPFLLLSFPPSFLPSSFLPSFPSLALPFLSCPFLSFPFISFPSHLPVSLPPFLSSFLFVPYPASGFTSTFLVMQITMPSGISKGASSHRPSLHTKAVPGGGTAHASFARGSDLHILGPVNLQLQLLTRFVFVQLMVPDSHMGAFEGPQKAVHSLHLTTCNDPVTELVFSLAIHRLTPRISDERICIQISANLEELLANVKGSRLRDHDPQAMLWMV